MADRPILFSAPMVRAILREIEKPGTGKTQTRRVIMHGETGAAPPRKPPVTNAGDRLYVREAWRCEARLDRRSPRDIATNYPGVKYVATDEPDDFGIEGKFRQAMHMPRWASRITLIVTDVRVQRLQEISEVDAIAEGIEGDPVQAWHCYASEPKMQTHWLDPRESYRTLWDAINGDRPGCAWRHNPFVAAYTFKPILGNIDQAAK